MAVPVKPDSDRQCLQYHSKTVMGGCDSGNVEPLLHQIRHALQHLLSSGETTTIDLRGLPMAAGERERLLSFLGRGEVSVRLEALGRSDIVETGFSGVWLITHYDGDGEIMGRFIEITRIPGILETGTADLEDALASLQNKLEQH